MPEHRQHVGVMWRAILVLVLMITAGCATRHPDFVTHVRPDFMARVRQDCSAGEQWACDLVDALSRPPSQTTVADSWKTDHTTARRGITEP
jgi:hypothetical protein